MKPIDRHDLVDIALSPVHKNGSNHFAQHVYISITNVENGKQVRKAEMILTPEQTESLIMQLIETRNLAMAQNRA